MTTRTHAAARQTAAFGLAVLATCSILVGVNLLAAQPAADAQLAKQSGPAQIVVIQARRGMQG